MLKIVNIEDIEIATATALQEWRRQAAKLQMLRADKANRELKSPDFWMLDRANTKTVQGNLNVDVQQVENLKDLDL